jgi:hypothetical protein
MSLWYVSSDDNYMFEFFFQFGAFLLNYNHM